jgi:four helix bundle protein
LSDQARRAAFSAAANIVEGVAKRGPREFRRFLDMSLGSLAELAYILMLVRDLGDITSAKWGELEALRDHAGQLTWGLYAAIDRKAKRTVTVKVRSGERAAQE